MGMFDSFKKSKPTVENGLPGYKKALEDADRLQAVVKYLQDRLAVAMEWKFWMDNPANPVDFKSQDRLLFLFHTGAVLQVRCDNRQRFVLISGLPVKGTPVAWFKLEPLDMKL